MKYSRSGGRKSSPGGMVRQAREQDPPIGDSRLNYDKGHEDHRMAYEALQKSILRDESEQFDAHKAEEHKKMKSKQDSPKTLPESPPLPPPPPPSSGASGASDDQSLGSATPGSSKTAATTAYIAWTMTTSRFKPSASSIPEDVFMHEESDFEAQDMVSDDEDIGSRHVPRVNLNQDWFKPLSEDERPTTPEPAWSIPSSSLPKQGITELTLEHLEGPAYEFVKAFHPDMIHLQFQMEECHKLLTNQVDERLLMYNISRPLPLGGPPGQVTIQTEFFFNRDLDYLRFGSKGDRLALSITKMKAAYYPDVGLEQMVPDQMWTEEECMYDISATYGISHWSPEPPTAMGQEDSLYCCQLMDQESGYQATATVLEFMYDYKILDSSRAVLFRYKYGMQMLMRFNEIHKFSDETLQQIDEALDYRTQAGSPPSMCQTISNIDAHVEGEQFHESKQSRYEFPRSRQSRRDLPRDNPLVSVEVLSEDGNPARANIKQALGLHKDGDADTSFQQSQVHSHMLIW
ncbi:hypothetical protein Tco_0140426 [Tanacetum coccineum]